MTFLVKKQQSEPSIGEVLQRLYGAPPKVAKGRVNENPKIKIKAPRETLSPLGWFHKHNAMHTGVIPIEYDQWGRCTRCVSLGIFRCDA